MCEKHRYFLGNDFAEQMVQSGKALKELVGIMKSADVTMKVEEVNSMLNCFKRHMALIKDWGVYTPKHHLMIHLITISLHFGKPNSALYGATNP